MSCSKDLDDSKLRVELMMAAKVQGDFDKAQSYAITDAERKEIETCRVRVQGLVGAKTTEQEVAAAKMQARIRGSQVREQKEKQKMEHAAILVQKSYRGHSERDNQEEQRRLTWLQCVQFSPSRPIAVVCFPFVGFLFIRWHLEQNEFGQALELAISKDERQRILTAKEGFPRRAVFRAGYCCISHAFA